jgi:cholesterol transport system auxiliary component
VTKADPDSVRLVQDGAARRWPFLPALLALGLAASLAGCASGSPVDTYDLTAATFSRPVRAPRGQVVVTEPLTLAPADSDRIVIRPTPDTVATIKGAQWVERLPRLVQTRLIQSFENGHVLRAVTRPDAGITAQYELNTEIRRFEIDLSRGEAVAEFSVKLVAQGTGRVVAAQIFTATAPAPSDTGAAASHALDEALGEVLRRIVGWTATQV